MARLYADEQLPVGIVYALRRLGHEATTVRETGLERAALRNNPSLTAGDLEAAWRYADAHRDEIEAEIRENNDH